jgi:hypothetical protein
MTDKTTELVEKINKNVIFPDITFVFNDDKKISCNKCIIAKCSKYFMDFFMENKDIKKEVDISNITSISYDTFVLYLAIIYYPSIDFSIISYDSWIELYKLDDYLISEIISNIIVQINKIDDECKIHNMYISYFNYFLNKCNNYYPNVIKMIENYAKHNIYEDIPIELFTPKLLWYYLDTGYVFKKIDIYLSKNYDKFTSIQLDLILFKMDIVSIGEKHIKSVNLQQLIRECDFVRYDRNFIYFVQKIQKLNN